jgi:putative transposase
MRRRAAAHLIEIGMRSQRRACQLMGIHPSVYRYQSRHCEDQPLRERLKTLAIEYPRYGYLLLHAMLKGEGLVVNAKKTYRIYREEKLQVKRRRRKRLPARDRGEMTIPVGPNRRWSMDFMSDQLATGRRFRILNIVDDYTRECPAQIVDFSISGQRLVRLLDDLHKTHGLPIEVVVDNGPELTSKAMFLWSQRTRVQIRFIQPGKPSQNAFVESFNGKLRDACLNEHWFTNIADARRIIESWRVHYNRVRPHSALGYRTPEQFRMANTEGYGKDGRIAALENPLGFPLSHSHDDRKSSLSERA